MPEEDVEALQELAAMILQDEEEVAEIEEAEDEEETAKPKVQAVPVK